MYTRKEAYQRIRNRETEPSKETYILEKRRIHSKTDMYTRKETCILEKKNIKESEIRKQRKSP